MKLFELHSILLEATPNQMLKKYRNDLGSTWGALHNTPHDGPVDGRDVLNTILNPSDEEQAEQDANATAAMDWLSSLPPGNKVNTYIEWLTKLFLTDNLDINDAEEIRYTLQAHVKAGNYANYRDPMQYRSMESMQNDLSDTIAKLRAKDAEAADAKAVSSGMGSKDSGAEAEQWIKGKMYRLNSVRAIKAFGSPQWCISHGEQSVETRSSYCLSYSNNWDEPFFLLTLPELGTHMRKVGVFPGTHGHGNFQDYNNNPLSDKAIRDIFDKYPDIYELMKPYISTSNFGWKTNLSDEEKVDAFLAGAYPLSEVPEKLRTEEFYHAAVRKSRMSIDQIPQEYQTEELWMDAGRIKVSAFVNAPEEYQTEENWRELIPVNSDKFVPRHARKALLSLPSKYLKDYEIITLLRTLHADDVSEKLTDVPKEHFTQEIVDTIVSHAPKLIRYLPSEMLTDEVCDQIVSHEYGWNQVRHVYNALPEDYVKRNLDKIPWESALTNPLFMKYAPDKYQRPNTWIHALTTAASLRRRKGNENMLTDVVSYMPKDIYNNAEVWDHALSNAHGDHAADIVELAPDAVKNDIKVWKNILGNYPSPSTVIDVMSAIPSNVMTSELYVDLMTKLSGQGHAHGNYEAAYIDKHDTLENWNQIVRANTFRDSSLNYVPDKILHSKEFWEDALFDEDDTIQRLASNSDMPDEVVTQEFFDQVYSKDPKVALQSSLKQFASERHWTEYVNEQPLRVMAMPAELTTDELWDNAEATHANDKMLLDIIQDYRAKRDRRRRDQ